MHLNIFLDFNNSGPFQVIGLANIYIFYRNPGKEEKQENEREL